MAKTTHKPDYEEAEETEDVSHAHETKPGPVTEGRQKAPKHEKAVPDPDETEKVVPAPLERAVPAPLETRDLQSVIPAGNPPVYTHAPGFHESAGMPDPEREV